jgi:rod shape determining protein RodA
MERMVGAQSVPRSLRQFDIPLLLAVLVLIGMGLAILYSATHAWAPGLFQRQLVWLGFGLLGMGVLTVLEPLVWMRRSRWLYGLNLLMLLLVELMGAERKGAQRWLELPGGFQVQPSEFAKLLLILTLASLLTQMGPPSVPCAAF